MHGAAQAVPWLLPGAAGALAGAPSASAARRRACHLRRTASAVRGCSCRSASHSRCQGSRQPPPRPRCRPSAGSAASASASAPAPGGLRASRVLTLCTVKRPVHGQGGCGWSSPLPRAPGQSQAAAAANVPATRVQRPGAPTPSQGGRQLGWQACWHILQVCVRARRPGLGEGVPGAPAARLMQRGRVRVGARTRAHRRRRAKQQRGGGHQRGRAARAGPRSARRRQRCRQPPARPRARIPTGLQRQPRRAAAAGRRVQAPPRGLQQPAGQAASGGRGA
jgi:hypothetical protein